METAAQRMFAEIEEERKEVKQKAWYTAGTLIGLLFGIGAIYNGFSAVAYAGFSLAYLAGGVPVTIEALRTLRNRSLDINLLTILAALAAAGVGEVRDGAILLFLFSLAGTLEGYAMGNTKRAVAALMKLRPDEANRLDTAGGTERVAVEMLQIGDRVVVRPGERMPIDGVIEAGAGAVDQSSVTGESVPVDRVPGDTVFAGTVNQNAVLTIRVTKRAEHSTIARMIELVTEAQEQRSPSERFSRWFGQRYTIAVLLGSLVAVVVFIWIGIPTDVALYKAATLLVVASPCAIVISVPAAVLSAIAAAARIGVLFKGGAAIEDFGMVDAVAFDKTGTLTAGKMSVTDVVSFGDVSEEEVLALAAAVEAHSEHPIAHSIREAAQARKLSIQETYNTEAIPGKGIVAQLGEISYWAGNRALLSDQGVVLTDSMKHQLHTLEQAGKTTVVVGRGMTALGAVGVADTIRATAPEALATLRAQGVDQFVILTGDNKLVAQAVGAQLQFAMEDIHGELLPEDKVKLVEALHAERNIAFVGDGVNDAAALATAHIGVAMGVGGSDVAIEAADVTLLSDDLTQLARAHALAQRANRIIKQNLIFAVAIMLLMVVITIFWSLPLPLGVIGHEGGTLLVVANGLRMLFQKV